MEEEREDIIVLVDEDGQEVEFEHVDTVEMNGNEYVILLPLEEEEESEDDEDIDEVIILKVEHISEDEDTFISVEDEAELSLVFEEFKKQMEDEYEEEE